MKDLLIKRVTLKDLTIIYEFMRNQADDERKFLNNLDKKEEKDLFYSKSEIKKIISSPKSYLLLAKVNNFPVGCAMAKIEETSKWNKYNKQGYLGMLYVVKKYRRQGIAQTLQNERIRWLKSKGAAFLITYVLSDNIPAVNLLEKKGFKPRLIQMCRELK